MPKRETRSRNLSEYRRVGAFPVGRAAMKGAQAHHWPFGDMPAVPGITKRSMDQIAAYVRWLQRENGIY